MKDYKKLIKKGASVVFENNKIVTLQLPKKFNWIAFILLSIFFNVVGLCGYIIYYVLKAPQQKTFEKHPKKKEN